MIPLILGFGSAALFLGLSMLVYGAGALMESAWVALVFSGLIASGLLVQAIIRPPAWLCRLQRRVEAVDDLCDTSAPCRC
jgi:hypothetical protein